MADALCGPSNALQSFQKHTSVDRTLQQDRFTGPRHSPAQGFRTFDPRAGSLDAEFHAFENAPPNPFQLEQPQWHHTMPSVPPVLSSASWANDFQNLRISNSPLPAQHFQIEAPLERSAPGDWQQEFMRQTPRQSASPAAKQKQPEIDTRSNYMHTPMAQFGGLSFPQQSHDNIVQSMAAPESQFDEAAFERAFQDAFNDLQSLNTLEAAKEEFAPQSDPVAEQEIALIHEPEKTKIGSDAIAYTEVEDRMPDQDTRDASDLARVAGDLIHSVSHEKNEKFRNSQFLDLMRRIRDREVEVRNNDFEQTVQQVSQSEASVQAERLQPHDPNTFQFPDMNNVYKVDGPVDMTPDYADYHPAETQISDLHPGGPYYPEQSPRAQFAQMSGAIRPFPPSDDSNGYAAA